MNPAPTRKPQAFTRVDLIVVIVILMGLTVWLAPTRVRSGMNRISCQNNLKMIGTAYRLWAGDNGDRNPAEQTVANGGWAEFLTNPGQGAICWTNYAIMQNELGQSPKLVICPSDARESAADFAAGFKE